MIKQVPSNLKKKTFHEEERMDQEKETEILDRIAKLEARLSALEEKVWKLIRETPPDLPQPEPESDEPIIDG